MTKEIKKSKTIVMPTLKEKKRFVLIQSSSKSIEKIKQSIKEYFGIDNLAKSGFMHLKEFDSFTQKRYNFVFKINPKYLSLLARSIIFSDLNIELSINRIFGNVKKLKLFLQDPKISICDTTDIIKITTKVDLDKIKKIKSKKNQIFAISLKLFLSKDNNDLIHNSDHKFILLIQKYDEIEELKKIISKSNVSYIINFDSYDNYDLIKLTQSLKVKPLAIFNLEKNKKSDFLRFRNSNFNQVIAKYFVENKLFYGVNLMSLSSKDNNKYVYLGRLFQNLNICSKYNIPIGIYNLKQLTNKKILLDQNLKLAFKDFQIENFNVNMF